MFNPKEKKCLTKDCEEYPDYSPGCMICKNKIDEYKKNKKCQMCKYGYFKTKEEIFVYFNSEQYGGPSCYECGYEIDNNGDETEQIICKNVFRIIMMNLVFIFFFLVISLDSYLQIVNAIIVKLCFLIVILLNFEKIIIISNIYPVKLVFLDTI